MDYRAQLIALSKKMYEKEPHELTEDEQELLMKKYLEERNISFDDPLTEFDPRKTTRVPFAQAMHPSCSYDIKEFPAILHSNISHTKEIAPPGITIEQLWKLVKNINVPKKILFPQRHTLDELPYVDHTITPTASFDAVRPHQDSVEQGYFIDPTPTIVIEPHPENGFYTKKNED